MTALSNYMGAFFKTVGVSLKLMSDVLNVSIFSTIMFNNAPKKLNIALTKQGAR